MKYATDEPLRVKGTRTADVGNSDQALVARLTGVSLRYGKTHALDAITLDLSRDPIRMALAGLGSVILMIIMGYGITIDVEHLKYAVLDRDQTSASRDYTINIAGSSRYFTERRPVAPTTTSSTGVCGRGS